MINEKEFQDRINRRLSGITASEQRRMRIRNAVDPERKDLQPMKRPFSKALVFAVVAAMLVATVAFAEYFNLFNFFGEHDERYNAITPYATLTITEPVLIEQPDLENAVASIDSAYFDGLSLNLAYRITRGQKVEEYTPTKTELALMEKGNPGTLVAGLSENEPGIEILKAWNQAIENGNPYGYRKTTIYTSDHSITGDGVNIYPDSASPRYNENGEFCEMREFECPLPEELRSCRELTIDIDVRKMTACYWFGGIDCYRNSVSSEVGTMTAVIPRNGEIRHFSGTGKINGAACTIEAEVSPMVSVMTFRSDAAFNTFLSTAPEGTDEHDCWVEVIPIDENGNKYSQNECPPLDDRNEITLSFRGTGVLPEELTVYVTDNV